MDQELDLGLQNPLWFFLVLVGKKERGRLATKLTFESRSIYRCLSIICCPWSRKGAFEALRGDFAIGTCCQAMNT